MAMDRVSRLGLLAGGLTSLSGLVGYYVVPIVTEAADSLQGSFASVAVDTISRSSIGHHAAVLTVPSFLVTAGAVILVRHWERSSREADCKLVGGIVLTPILAAVATYLVVALVVAGTFVYGTLLAGLELSVPDVRGVEGLLLYVLAIFGGMLYVLGVLVVTLFVGGAMLVSRVLPVIVLAVGAGTIVGYAAGRGVTRFREVELPDRN